MKVRVSYNTDLEDVPDTIKKSLKITAVKNVDEVLKIALTKDLKRVDWVDVEQIDKKSKKAPLTSRH